MAKTVKIAPTTPTTLVAVAAIMVDGKHFERGQPVEGVDGEQLRLAVNARRVIPFDDFQRQGLLHSVEDAPEDDAAEDEAAPSAG